MNHAGDDDDALADAFRQRLRGRDPGGPCPEPATLYEAASGELPLAERQRIIDHVAGCAECTEAWRLAMDVAGPDAEQQSAEVTWLDKWRGRGRPAVAGTRALTRLAIAAGIGTLGVLVLLTLPRTDPVPGLEPGYRDATGQTVIESRSPATLPRERFLLRWSGAPSGSTYTLRLTTSDLEPVLTQAGIDAPEFLVPEPALAAIAAGDALLWQVEATAGTARGQTSAAHVVTVE